MDRSRSFPGRFAIRWLSVIGIVLWCVSALAGPAKPQESNAPDAGAPASEEPIDPGSPRATMTDFLQHCREGRYDEAARYLDVSAAQQSRAPVLARRLKAVIDWHVWIDLDTLSPAAAGDPNDGLPAAFEIVAKFSVTSGKSESIRLFRRAALGQTPAWVISHTTVDQIDRWYAALPQRWLLDHLPAWLLRSGPKELLVWQWIALPCLFLMAWGVGALLDQLTRRIISSLAQRRASVWNAALLRRLRGPFTLVWTLTVVYLTVPLLGLYRPAEQFVHRMLNGGYFFILFWGLSRLIDAWGKAVAESEWASQRSSAKALVPIGVRLGKILLIVIAVVFLVSALGYPAASIVAGLGVGGLAVALAAQKTLENLFGAFTIGADQPFRVGDFVKIEDFVGTVESIGLRSSRIRTLDRTVITIPNGRLSDTRVESFAARDRIRLSCNLGLVYDTTAAQMREVLAGCDRVLREHPKIWPDVISIYFNALGESALNIEVMAWFDTADWNEFQRIRQEVLLEFMGVIERAGTALAYPTRTIRQEPGPNPGDSKRA